MIISAIAFIVAFTLVVLVHELGHFIAARKAGIRVYEFSIGFPLFYRDSQREPRANEPFPAPCIGWWTVVHAFN